MPDREDDLFQANIGTHAMLGVDDDDDDAGDNDDVNDDYDDDDEAGDLR